MKPAEALAHWQTALGLEFGHRIKIEPATPEAIRKAQKILYDARKASDDERLQSLMMCLPAGGEEIWLVKKEVELDQ